jgi:hypothetical protein
MVASSHDGAAGKADADPSSPETGAGDEGEAGMADKAQLADDATAQEASDADTDANADADADACGSGCIVVPPGWTLVVFTPTQSVPCPTGFAQQPPTDLSEGPNAGNACACGACGVTTQPSCPIQPIGVHFGSVPAATPVCGMTAPSFPNGKPGLCNNDVQRPATPIIDIAFAAPSSTGAACASPGQPQAGQVTFASQGRACVPDSAASAGCSGTTCTPSVTSPYAACIMSPGQVDCPPGPSTMKHLVGTGVTFSCSDCACSVSAACTGSVTLFNDANGTCDPNNLVATIVADGTCHPAPIFTTYQYSGNPPTGVLCSTTGPSSASGVVLQNPATLCCAH